jgi:hypothetical protein
MYATFSEKIGQKAVKLQSKMGTEAKRKDTNSPNTMP